MNYGFIGAGNMAYSFIRGMLENGAADKNNIFIYEKNSERQKEVCKSLQISVFNSAFELAENCKIIFLAVKPVTLPEVLPEIAEITERRDCIIVSFAAGKTIEYICSFLKPKAKVIRIMPNINAEISKSMTAYCCNEFVTEYDKLEAVKCLSAVGQAAELEEQLFSVFTAVAGCSPAFVYLFIDSLATAAVKLGMNKKTALEIAAQAVYGSSEMVIKSDIHPRQLIDNVCSPGGATIEGVCELLENRFESAVVSAVEAAYNKAKRL